ncbi:MAG: peptide ABC transporter substrate-binding protein [Pseudomonadales bacterium]
MLTLPLKALCSSLLLLLVCPAWAGRAVDAAQQSIQLALTTEPPNLNSLTATDSVSFFVLAHTQEGLLTYDDKGELTGGVAKNWQVDGNSVRFTLRDNARWCDGKPVTAQDFVFAWRTALAAETGSRYAFIFYPLRNAQQVHEGKLPADALGVYAEDAQHLRVELAQPTAYFLSLTTFATYYPLREDFYQSRKKNYAADADKLLCNGAFRLSNWVHGASLRLEKNPNYWNAESVKLQTINIPHITNDTGTLLNLFQAGEIAFAELSRDTLPLALEQRLYLQSFNKGMLHYMEFNFQSPHLLSNAALRRAISSIIDRNTLVNKVIASPGTQATAHFFPDWLPGIAAHTDIPQPDLVAAQKALAQAKQELGISQIPPLTLLIYDSPSVVRQAEYLQRVFQETLGITLVIDKQIFKQKLAKLNSGAFDLALSAWGPDYNDPMTFADLLHSANANNHGRYKNTAYDSLVEQAAALPISPARNALFQKMDHIIQQDVAVLPLSEPGIIYVQDRRLHNVRRSRFGDDPDFRHAWIAEPAQGNL